MEQVTEATHAPVEDDDASSDGRDKFVIIVNASPKKVRDETVTYKEVVEIAFPGGTSNADLIFEVDFENAASKPHAGSLVDGQQAEVKHSGTEFSVIRSVRS